MWESSLCHAKRIKYIKVCATQACQWSTADSLGLKFLRTWCGLRRNQTGYSPLWTMSISCHDHDHQAELHSEPEPQGSVTYRKQLDVGVSVHAEGWQRTTVLIQNHTLRTPTALVLQERWWQNRTRKHQWEQTFFFLTLSQITKKKNNKNADLSKCCKTTCSEPAVGFLRSVQIVCYPPLLTENQHRVMVSPVSVCE